MKKQSQMKMVSPKARMSAVPGYAEGGMVMGYADGGMVVGYAFGGMAHGTQDLRRQVLGPPNACEYNLGPGTRSFQDYKK